MMTRSIKRKLVKAKISLNHTIQRILDINRQRKKLHYLQNPSKKKENLDDELRVLNKLAEHQVGLIKRYEKELSTEDDDPKTMKPRRSNLPAAG